jgi:hypothetical protein
MQTPEKGIEIYLDITEDHPITIENETIELKAGQSFFVTQSKRWGDNQELDNFFSQRSHLTVVKKIAIKERLNIQKHPIMHSVILQKT